MLAKGYSRPLVEILERAEGGLYYSAARYAATTSSIDWDTVMRLRLSRSIFVLLDAGRAEKWFSANTSRCIGVAQEPFGWVSSLSYWE